MGEKTVWIARAWVLGYFHNLWEFSIFKFKFFMIDSYSKISHALFPLGEGRYAGEN